MSLLLVYAPAAAVCCIVEHIAKHKHHKRKAYRPGKVQRFAQ